MIRIRLVTASRVRKYTWYNSNTHTEDTTLNDMKSPQEKILYLITKSNWGGAQRYVYDLACEAKQNGYLPVVGCGGNGVLTEKLKEQDISVAPIKSFQRDVNLIKELLSFFDVIRLVRAERPIIVHVNSSKAGGIGALAARISSRACIVFTVHGLPQREKRSFLSRIFISFATWLTALLSHRIITVTHEDAMTLRKQPFLKHKVEHIQLGVERNVIPKDEARAYIRSHLDASDIQKLSGNTLWVGTVAELTDNKGHRYALEAFTHTIKKYPDVRYILIGNGELEAKLKTYAEHHGLQDHVIFAGFIPNAASLYSAFDIYLASSVKEGLPYTILEALTSGTPIIATRVGGIPDVIKHTESGHLIDAESSHEIHEALTRLIEDESYRALLGRQAQEDAARLQTKKLMAENTFRLYGECAQPNISEVSQVVR